MNRRALLATAVLAVAATGCIQVRLSSSPTEPERRDTSTTVSTTTTSTTTTIPVDEAVDAFHSCMASNGIDLEPVPVDALGRPRLDLVMRDVDLTAEMVQAALGECASHLTAGALSLVDEPELEERVLESLAEFSECMRRGGVEDFPDPDPAFTGTGPPYPVSQIPYGDPDLSAVADACTTWAARSQ